MITRKQFADEERRIEKLKRAGWTDHQIKGWLRGWREVGRRYAKR